MMACHPFLFVVGIISLKGPGSFPDWEIPTFAGQAAQTRPPECESEGGGKCWKEAGSAWRPFGGDR